MFKQHFSLNSWTKALNRKDYLYNVALDLENLVPLGLLNCQM